MALLPVLRCRFRAFAGALLLAALALPAAGPVRAADETGAPPETMPPAVRASASAGNLTALEAYVAAHPADHDAQRFLGDLYVRAGDTAKAEAAYKALVAASPGDKMTHDRLGNLYAQLDRIDDAVAEFEKALPDVAAFSDLVRLHRRLGDLSAFVAAYRARALADTSDAAVQFAYGVILRELRKPEEALPYLYAALRNSPRSCAALTEVGNAQLDLGETAAAETSFRQCLAIEPNDYSALVDLSDALGPEHLAEARGLLDRAAVQRPNRPEAFVDLGYLDDATGDVESAVRRYLHALELDPFSRDAYVDLGYAYLEQGRLEPAEATLLRGLGVSRDDGRLEYLLGKLFERQGKTDLARREFRSAAQSDEPDVAAAAGREVASTP
jgi:superkiller protein 3